MRPCVEACLHRLLAPLACTARLTKTSEPNRMPQDAPDGPRHPSLDEFCSTFDGVVCGDHGSLDALTDVIDGIALREGAEHAP